MCGFPEDKAHEFVMHVLSGGKCLVLLDGFDEVAGNTDRAVSEINQLVQRCPNNRYVLSCRLAAHSYVFESFVDVEMADFDDEQVDSFVRNWFGKDAKTASECLLRLRDPENKPIRELASVPLLLTLLCIAYDDALDFPPNRADLYKDAMDALLKKWDTSRRVKREDVYKWMTLRQKEVMLSRIAASTFEQGRYFIPRVDLETRIAEHISNLQGSAPDAATTPLSVESETVLRSIEAHHGLLVERAKGVYSFSHLTVQEYFTARHIVDTEAGGSVDKLIAKHLFEAEWREVFLLIAGMISYTGNFVVKIRERISRLEMEWLTNRLQRNMPAAIEHRCAAPGALARASWLLRLFGHVEGTQSDILEVQNLARDLFEAIERACASQGADIHTSSHDDDLKHVESDLTEVARDLITRGKSLRIVRDYLYGNLLLLSCMEAACYLPRFTRERLLDGVLKEPWTAINLTDASRRQVVGG